MQEWEKQSIEKAKLSFETQAIENSKISLYPTFHKKEPVIQLFDNADNVCEAFGAMSRRVYLNILESKRGKKVLADAKKYNIPYDKENIDWLSLIAQIKEYKLLLKQAKDNYLIWDTKDYDPRALEQLIEDYISQERRWNRDQNSNYLSTRL